MIPILMISGELSDIWNSDKSFSLVFWPVFGTGLLGFAINIAVFLQIKVTSPLTSVIVGTTKVKT
jgi:GDP-fucose transporter C1